MLPTPIDGPFEYVRIVRSGGLAGAIDVLHIDRTLRAAVSESMGDRRNFYLESREAEELTQALGAVVAKSTANPGDQGPDMYQYDIEIGWGGKVVRVHSTGLGTDEALHGVIVAASNLFSRERDDVPGVMAAMGTGMDLHVRPSSMEQWPEVKSTLPTATSPEELVRLVTKG